MKVYQLSLVALVIVLGLLYFVYDPAASALFPRCPVYAVTGFQCTGCGSQRAFHALLHGHIVQAWHFNPLALIAMPYIVVGLIAERSARESISWARFRKTFYGNRAIVVSLLVIVLYTVGRNF